MKQVVPLDLPDRYFTTSKLQERYGIKAPITLRIWRRALGIEQPHKGQAFANSDVFCLDEMYIAVRLERLTIKAYESLILSGNNLNKYLTQRYRVTLLEHLINLSDRNQQIKDDAVVQDTIARLTTATTTIDEES